MAPEASVYSNHPCPDELTLVILQCFSSKVTYSPGALFLGQEVQKLPFCTKSAPPHCLPVLSALYFPFVLQEYLKSGAQHWGFTCRESVRQCLILLCFLHAVWESKCSQMSRVCAGTGLSGGLAAHQEWDWSELAGPVLDPHLGVPVCVTSTVKTGILGPRGGTGFRQQTDQEGQGMLWCWYSWERLPASLLEGKNCSSWLNLPSL